MHTPVPILRRPTPAGFSALLATYLLFLASCSGQPTEEAANDLAERCGTKDPGVPVQALPYDAGTGEGVDGFVLGEGKMGVVFSNQTDTDLCDWLPLAKETAGEGRKALIYDYSYKPDAAREVEAAAELAELGVEQAVLVGASKGAVASLSAVGEYEGLNSVDAAGKVRVPLLVLAARGDLTTDAGEVAPELAKVSPSEDKRVVVFDGTDHGIDLLKGEHGPRVRGLLKDFIDRNLRRG